MAGEARGGGAGETDPPIRSMLPHGLYVIAPDLQRVFGVHK